MTKFLLIFLLLPLSILANPVDSNNYKNSDGSYNFYVEIPAGTRQKWEVNKDGILEWEEKKGKKRIVNFLSYPGNYGFIPQTVGGDEDPIDVIDLETAVNRGQVVSRKIIGGMYFEDKKEVDVKLIAIDPNDIFSKYDSIENLMLDRPAVIEIIKKWFESYKKPGKMIFFRFMGKKESEEMIEKAYLEWKKNN